MSGINFTASVYKIQTLVDGGIRISFDLPETAIAEAAALMEAKRSEHTLKINATIEQTKRRGKASENID